MKTKVNGNFLTVTKEANDKNYFGAVNAAGESNFLYALKNHLNAMGFDLIKKRMWKDGHLVDDMQQYLRTSNEKSKSPHIYLLNNRWAIDGLNDRWNEYGEVDVLIEFDVFEKQPHCRQLMEQLVNEGTAKMKVIVSADEEHTRFDMHEENGFVPFATFASQEETEKYANENGLEVTAWID